MKTPADQRYDKVIEVWWLLNKLEQLMINDPDYAKVIQNITNSMDIVETLQHDIEVSGK
jgi:hypothetical protein